MKASLIGEADLRDDVTGAAGAIYAAMKASLIGEADVHLHLCRTYGPACRNEGLAHRRGGQLVPIVRRELG